jgi:RimJ/RimL family protein N-acetyltransferase
VIVRVLDAKEWAVLSKDAHLGTFGDDGFEHDKEVCDFAILVTTEDDEVLTYNTFKKIDKESFYTMFGGAFPKATEQGLTLACFEKTLERVKEIGAKEISFHVKNDNFRMLKFAIKASFKIVGVSYSNGKILLEHKKEL